MNSDQDLLSVPGLFDMYDSKRVSPREVLLYGIRTENSKISLDAGSHSDYYTYMIII